MEFDRKVPVEQRLKKDQQRISREGSKLIRSPGRRVGRRRANTLTDILPRSEQFELHA